MVIVNEEEVWNIVLPEVLPELYCTLEVAVVAAADSTVDDARTVLADVCIFSVSDAEDTPHRSKVEPALHIIHIAKLRNHTSVACYDNQLSCGLLCRDSLLEICNLSLIEKSDVTSVIEFSIKKGRVDLGIPDKA